MACFNPSNPLHIDLLKKNQIFLDSNGEVINKGKLKLYTKKIILGYRDEGPDAWAGSEHFDGPAWVWTSISGWEFYEKGVTITGYDGLVATVVDIVNGHLHVTKCYGE